MESNHTPSAAQSATDAGERKLSIHWQPYNIVDNYMGWLMASGIVILIGLLYMALNFTKYDAPFKLGIDFQGGTLLSQTYEGDAAAKLTSEAVEEIVGKIDTSAPTVQVSEGEGGQRTVLIRASTALAGEEGRERLSQLLNDLKTTFGDPVEGTQSIEEVSPTIQGELIGRALQGLFWGNLLVFLYITVRMRLDFAFFGIVALLHDLAITTGFMAVMSYYFGWEINSWFVAVILTILGYSINDTIVIYDRIRENLHLYAGHPFPTIVNYSLVQTMSRSINTSVTVILVLGAMLIGQTFAGGGGGLKEFNATMLAGVISGAYSTIFIASQLLVAYYRYKEKRGGTGFIADAAAAKALAASGGKVPVVAQVRTIEPRNIPSAPAGPRTVSGAEIMGGTKPATANGASMGEGGEGGRPSKASKAAPSARVKKKRW